jgi:hypothetical protein
MITIKIRYGKFIIKNKKIKINIIYILIIKKKLKGIILIKMKRLK